MAKARVFWCSYSFLKTSDTKPNSKAFCAGIRSPVKMYLIALYLPADRANLCVPPIPGISPSLTSGSPNLASSEHTSTSVSNANYAPPPSATPLTPHTIGLAALSKLGLAYRGCGGSTRRCRCLRSHLMPYFQTIWYWLQRKMPSRPYSKDILFGS